VILEPQTAGIPEPNVTELSRPFWQGARDGKLLYQYFPSSGRAVFNPAPVDRYSLSSDYEWRESAGKGTIYSFTTVWRPQTPAFTVPYVAAIVDVDEGYQMISNIIGCEPDEVFVGQRVEVAFHRVSETLTLPYFRPAK
jgi:uncharacterized OB-fold protein